MGEKKRRLAAMSKTTPPGAKMVRVSEYLMVPAHLESDYWEGLEQLTREALNFQGEAPNPAEFTKRAAAIHEAAHCVVAAREGRTLAKAEIREQSGGWVGAFHTAGGGTWLDLLDRNSIAPQLRIVLAGRRGELLLAPKFYVYAGLNELVWCQLAILGIVAVAGGMNHYPTIWGSVLSETDATLREHKDAVLAIADELERHGSIGQEWLADALVSIPIRTEEPPLLEESEQHVQPGDPLI